MDSTVNLLLELDKLKSVYRKSYLSDGSRNENSAEHSWHLAVALLSFEALMPHDVRMEHMLRMALLHDVCEIGPGDVCAYHEAPDKHADEQAYLEALAARFPTLGREALLLWHEYESQQSVESHWVKLIDKLLPFLLNLASEGRTWSEQCITRSQVEQHNAFVATVEPEIHAWMLKQIDHAVASGWLANS